MTGIRYRWELLQLEANCPGHKLCSKCEVLKPFDNFSLSKTNRHGRVPYCKECARKIANSKYIPRPPKPPKPIKYSIKAERKFLNELGVRWCADCNGYLPLNKFERSRNICREHQNTKLRKTGMTRAEYAAFQSARATRTAAIKAAKKAAIEAERFEKQQVAALRKAWWQAQQVFYAGARAEIKRAAMDRNNARDLQRAIDKAGCKTVEEYNEWKKKEQQRQWDEKFPNRAARKKVAEQWKTTKRRLQGKENRQKIPHPWLAEQMEHQGGECIYCGHDISDGDYHIDHKQPLSRGGDNSLENLQFLCGPCNMKKHDKTHIEYMTEYYQKNIKIFQKAA